MQRACISVSIGFVNSQTVSIGFVNWQNLFILKYIFTTINIVQHALENKSKFLIGKLGSESVRREC